MKTLPVIDRPSWLPLSAWPWPARALSHDTGRIAVTDVGHGPALLFVHVGAWSFVWRDVIMRLQNNFRCVTLDAPGAGLSDRSKSRPTLADAGDAVATVMEQLDLRDVTLVAHDLGGPPAFLAACRQPGRVARLAAVNCFAWRPTGPLFRAMLALMGSAPARASDAAIGWLPRVTATSFGVGRHWDRSDLAVFRAGIDRAARRAWHGYFRDARTADTIYAEVDAGLRGPLSDRPLLTVFGQYNDPLRFQPKWKALFPHAQQVTVRRGNHFPMCDDPSLVASELEAFAK